MILFRLKGIDEELQFDFLEYDKYDILNLNGVTEHFLCINSR